MDAAVVGDLEIFLQLWKNPHLYSAERGSLRSHLLMQAHNGAVDILRSDTARTAREFAEDVPPKAQRPETNAAALAVLERAEVDEFVSALPATERHSIVLAYFGGHTYRDVARLLGVPEGTIKSRIRSGLRRLHTEGVAMVDRATSTCTTPGVTEASQRAG